MGLAAAAGLAVIGVVAITMSGEAKEPVALAVSFLNPLHFLSLIILFLGPQIHPPSIEGIAEILGALGASAC